MSNLSIGLVTSPNEETNQLVNYLKEHGVTILYTISPQEIEDFHIESEALDVWLLNVDDEHWHDNIDQLLDESDASIYFNEPGTLSKQSHPEYWCQNLVNRLYELTGLTANESSQSPSQKMEISSNNVEIETEVSQDTPDQGEVTQESQLQEDSTSGEESPEALDKAAEDLNSAFEELESSSFGLPSDIAAELVSELENISPDLESTELDSPIDEFEESVSSTDEESEYLEEISASGLEVETEEQSETAQEIIPELEIESEPELAQKLEMEFDSEFDTEINLENEIEENNDLAELQTQDLDFQLAEVNLEVNVDSGSETVDSSSNQQDDLDEQQINFEQAPDIIEEIDFSNSSIPMLESARDDVQLSLNSNFDTDTNSIELESDSEANDEINTDEDVYADLSLELEQTSIETTKSSLSEQEENTFDLTSELELVSEELSIDIPQVDKQITEKADFLQDFDSELDKIDETDKETEQEEIGLTLESMEEETVSGKAIFIEEQQPINTDTNNDTLDDAEFERPLGDLTLELIEEEKPTGKAVFIDDEEISPVVPEQASETTTESQQEELETGGLTLEGFDGEKPSGKAVFIEEEISGVEENEAININEQPTIELDIGDLTLETDTDQNTDGKAIFIDEQEIPILTQEEIIDPSLEEKSVELKLDSIDEQAVEAESDLQQTEVPIQVDEEYIDSNALDEELSKETEIDLGQLLPQPNQVEELEIEIPMLEEAAVGLQFNEIDEPTVEEELLPCWAIGASLGGPAALKRFLQSLPADINASFIIAQHIDDNFLPVLADILSSSSSFDVKVANGSNPMEAGKVYLAPLKGKIVFLKDGSMLVDHSQKWSEPYTPCIDDVVSSLSSVYGDKSGAIILSGMGQDGLKGAREMLNQGGQVWAQSLDTCADSSMPEAIINQGLTQIIEPPEKLARRLADYLS